jgi:hypothetical protein
VVPSTKSLHDGRASIVACTREAQRLRCGVILCELSHEARRNGVPAFD